MYFQPNPVGTTKVVLGSWGPELEADIQCAVISNGGVLITGPTANAEAIAREIHRRGLRSREPFIVVDCGAPNCLRLPPVERPGGTLLLRDVDRLSPPLQSELMARIADRRWRVIASSGKCPKGTLEPRLFYHLNMVYIILGSRLSVEAGLETHLPH